MRYDWNEMNPNLIPSWLLRDVMALYLDGKVSLSKSAELLNQYVAGDTSVVQQINELNNSLPLTGSEIRPT